MKRVHLVAAKPMRYGTRRLRAGDTFAATNQEARVLVAVGMAREGARPETKPALRSGKKRAEPPAPNLFQHVVQDGVDGDGFATDKPAPVEASEPEATDDPGPVEVPSPQAIDDLEALREAYRAQTGRRPHHMWTADRIRAAMAELDAQGGA